ncbi:MAG: hypothetical protein AAGB02_01460 [Pseudomonadota bacterium]
MNGAELSNIEAMVMIVLWPIAALALYKLIGFLFVRRTDASKQAYRDSFRDTGPALHFFDWILRWGFRIIGFAICLFAVAAVMIGLGAQPSG